MMQSSILSTNTLRLLLPKKESTLLPTLRNQNKIGVKHFSNIEIKQTGLRLESVNMSN